MNIAIQIFLNKFEYTNICPTMTPMSSNYTKEDKKG